MELISNIIEKTITSPIRVTYDKIYDMVGMNNHVKRSYEPNFINEYAYFFSDPTKVRERIYVGSAYNASCYNTLKRLNIKYIVNVTHEISNYHESCGEFLYHNIRIKDDGSDSIKPYLDDSFEAIENFLHNNPENVLIHCYMGGSRSVSILINYIVRKEKKMIPEVITELKTLRSSINPAINFIEELS